MAKRAQEKAIGRGAGKEATQNSSMRLALIDLIAAQDFYDRVVASSPDERVAVGRDHIDWLLSAARNATIEAKILREEIETWT